MTKTSTDTTSIQSPFPFEDLPSLMAFRQGGLDGNWPYEVTFPDGTKRYVLGVSPKDAAAKACGAKRCSKDEVIKALMEAVKT